MCGTLLHLKVMFVRYLSPEDRTEHFDCVINVDDVYSYSNSAELWREGEDVPPNTVRAIELPRYEIDAPINENLLAMVEIDKLIPGDELERVHTTAPITVISTKGAPDEWRLRDDRDNTYFNVDRHGMTFYGWRSSSASV